MRRISSTVQSVIGHLAARTGIYRSRFATNMTIVAFHRVNDWIPEDGLTCGTARFTAFCSFFRDNFRVVPFADQVSGCHAGRNMGGTLSITLDDGYLDNYAIAAPILRQLGLHATFFVTTGFIGSTTIAPWDRQLPIQPGWMTWDNVRALASQGFDIGAHTVNHVDLSLADESTVRHELTVSKEDLERELGRPAPLFAYPFGRHSQITRRALQIVRETGYASCASCCGGVNEPVADPYRLNRIGISDWFATPQQFGAAMLFGGC